MKKEFAKDLRHFRQLKGISQSELANKLGTTQRRISYFELGKIEPDIDTLCRIAKFFDVSVDELLGEI